MPRSESSKSIFLRDSPIICREHDLRRIYAIFEEFRALCLDSESDKSSKESGAGSVSIDEIEITAKNARGVSAHFSDVDRVIEYNRRFPESIESIELRFRGQFDPKHLFFSLNNEIGKCLSYTIRGDLMHVEYIDQKIEVLLQQASPWYSILARQNSNLLSVLYYPLIFYIAYTIIQQNRSSFDVDVWLSNFYIFSGLTVLSFIMMVIFPNRIRAMLKYIFPPVDFCFGAGTDRSSKAEMVRGLLIVGPLTSLLIPIIQAILI